jgi:hypothetical protein
MVFLVESIEVGDLVLWVGDARAAVVDRFSCVLIVTYRRTSGSTPNSQMIKQLTCRNAESPHLSNQAVSCRNARMNQAQCMAGSLPADTRDTRRSARPVDS